MSDGPKYRMQSAGHRRDIVTTLQEATTYVDRDSGTKFQVVGQVAPLNSPGSQLEWSPENLRACGCSRNQLAQRDLNDCPYCGRRMPAVDSASDAASN
ncbi:MAG: hypothetical protein JHC87_06790 [Thermoleophilaceae bacterium]|nr:hypothetical protein [Thermoleophilaceae bacterium]